MAENIYSVKHTMMITMVDGKICNAATGTTSTMRYNICDLTSKDFNNLSIIKQVNLETLDFRIFVLHVKIRLFESIIHISYKQIVKK